MTDAEIIASAREAELRNLFSALVRGVASLDRNAAASFAEKLRAVAEAERIALLALGAPREGTR